jgi:urease accessory protein
VHSFTNFFNFIKNITMPSPFPISSRTGGSAGLLMLLPLLVVLCSQPVLAHHPLGMAEGTPLTPLLGLLSGFGHPLLGIDHAFFLISIAFVGLTSLRSWILPLLMVGLTGSIASQMIDPARLPAGMEVVVALSLVVSGLVALKLLPAPVLLPMMFLHGFVLGKQITGSEPTPILFYFVGLFISQAILLIATSKLARSLHHQINDRLRPYLAYGLISIGIAMALSAYQTA